MCIRDRRRVHGQDSPSSVHRLHAKGESLNLNAIPGAFPCRKVTRLKLKAERLLWFQDSILYVLEPGWVRRGTFKVKSANPMTHFLGYRLSQKESHMEIDLKFYDPLHERGEKTKRYILSKESLFLMELNRRDKIRRGINLAEKTM
eukprot:TRINITY_DN13749_c0_g1_i3.p1 TRINITY_DN13749_c0_g1~~TRINITY_DN13749_c0_g1_i3.p1  ORF type:complete len:166 (+),score=42.64 TRINITY_DN13749_c0_g1_i3:61-498(+)